MNVAAFWLLASMLTFYVVLDGYDLGVAMITPFIARTDDERLASIRSIGPFWNGNEVWLIATAAVLFALFPQAYASAFSGFYLAFIVVLWLLMVRGISIELRSHFPSRIWHDFWDACFSLASVLLVFLFGVTLGNLLRGLPLDTNGFFQGTFTFLLNPYALAVGIFAVITLALHGAAFLILRLDGTPAERAHKAFSGMWNAVLTLYVITTGWTLLLRSGIGGVRPFVVAIVAVSFVTLIVIRVACGRKRAFLTFLASGTFLATLVVAAAGTIFPYLLPSYPNGLSGISIYSAAPSLTGLVSAVVVTVVGMIILVGYSTIVWRRMATKIRV